MKQVFAGTALEKDISNWVAVTLDGETVRIDNIESYPRRLRIQAKFITDLTGGSEVFWRIKIGSGGPQTREIANLSGSFIVAADQLDPIWQSGEIILGASGTNFDYLVLQFKSDTDSAETIETITHDIDDVGGLGGERVTLSAGNKLQVDVDTVLEANPIAIADILQKILDAFDTAIPGSPTASSINALIQFAFNVTECDWYLDTGQSPYEMVYHAKGDTGTEYVRKKLYQADGTPVITLAQLSVIGKHVEP